MSEVNVEKKNHITIITINRPEVMNCLTPITSKEMSLIINDYDEDSNQWVCIITGSGEKSFCAGTDLKYQAKYGGEVFQKQYSEVKGLFGGITNRFDCFKPFIAAVNGIALGGGFEMALACDIIIASEQATFGLPEPRFGQMAGAGGVHRLPRQLPYHIAMGMIMTANLITAQEAHQYGLVNEVVAPDKLMTTAERWAVEIMKGSPLSLRASKEAAVCGMRMPVLEDTITHKFPGELALLNSEDYMEGPKAFAEKRPPQWKAR
ncbi:MAG: enoyl-CoA hydratase-related protein [Smithellaceae bacterium]